MKRLILTLFSIVLILCLVVIGLLIGRCSCSPSVDAEPSMTPDIHVSTPEATAIPTPESTANTTETPVPTEAAGTEKPTDSPAPQPTPNVDINNIPKAVTDGSIDDVLARLEQLKALPSEATIVLLDVGHGGFDGGSVGLDSGVHEADLNLYVSRILAEKLAEKGYYVFMTRMGDYGVDSTKSKDMARRTEFMKLDIFDISVSIHMNSFPTDRSVKGSRVYCYQNGTPSARYAEIVARSICSATNTNFRNIYADDLMVVREPVAPSILVECGFISNSEEEAKLRTVAYQTTLAQAIADGIESFLGTLG